MTKKKKKSCHKNLIWGKHILCLHNIAIMGPGSTISVVCAFNCFTNNSMRGHVIDLNRHFPLSFWVKKIKVLNLMQQRQLSFKSYLLLMTPPKNLRNVLHLSALVLSLPPMMFASGLSFPSKLSCADF